MTFNTQTFRGKAILEPSRTPVVENLVSDATPLNVFTYIVPDTTKKIFIRARSSANLQLSFDVAFTNYITIPKNNSYNEDGILFSGTLYFKCDQASVTIEILTWS